MKFVGFTSKAVAKSRLLAFVLKFASNPNKLYWENLDYHEFQDGSFVVGFPDNYVTWLENNVPAAASKLKVTWQEAKADTIGQIRCRAK